MTQMSTEQWPLRRGSLVYPLPIAIACGRVLRSRTAAERVNACLKAAEVLTRYLAAVAVASFASRDDDSDGKLSVLSGNLSFGHFLTTVQEVAAAKGQHPVAPLLAQGFKKAKANQQLLRGKTDAALVELLELRNELGHELRNLDEAKAAAIEATKPPAALLIEALAGVEALLSKPLFVVEDQQWTREALVIRRLLLMGESADPTPQAIKVGHDTGGVAATNAPYLAINKTCLQLPPWLLWGIDRSRQNYALLFLDGVDDGRARYCTIDGTEQHRESDIADTVVRILSGTRTPGETVVLVDGRHLAQEWSEISRHLEESGRRQDGIVDWQAFDPATIQWFAGLLDKDAADPHALIRERILDGRTSFDEHERRQLLLLFGKSASVRSALKRDVLDIRIIDDNSMRPSDRELIEADNVLVAVKRAVAFLSKRLVQQVIAPEDLRRTDGETDYITIREMLLNQIIHQDYSDSQTPAQIELYAKKITLLNAGYSLVSTDHLLEGGKSQSRNPLIARALRAIGFAEISGSGIRAMARALRKARRAAPRFTNDQARNTFAVTLNWSEDVPDVDAFWMELVGAQLTAQQALVLNTLADLPSASVATLAGATKLTIEEITTVLDFLVLQVLIEQDEANYRLAAHLREKLG